MSSVAQLSSGLSTWNFPRKTPATFESLFPGNTAAGGIQQEQPTGGAESASPQMYFGSALSPRKPPAREGNLSSWLAHSRELWQASFHLLSADMELIKTQYVMRNEPAITQFFLANRTAAAFLSRAVPELKRSFGDDVVFSLEALNEDNDPTTLYAIAIWRGSAELADTAIEDFDERWWLNQTPQPGITFTYELA